MKEHYLHFLWKMKRFTSPFFKLSDGRDLKIIRFGILNQNLEGPDFNDCIIEIDNITWHGNIEMHVKSSDWYLHKHHQDELYNSVILHVVYVYDKEVYLQNSSIPTLVIKPFIDVLHYKNYLRFFKTSNSIVCHKLLKNDHLDVFFKEDLIFQKLMHRIHNISSKQIEIVFYELMTKAMARSINKEGYRRFYEITQNRFKRMVKFKKSTNVSNLINQEEELQVRELFHAKGNFPKGNPHLKYLAFLDLEIAFFTKFVWIELNASEIVQYFHNYFKESFKTQFSKSFVDHLIINAVSPFLFWYGELYQNENFQAKSIDILLLLPPEQNAIINNWKKTGLFVYSSYDTQVLLELFKNKCLKKDCLNCKIGFKLLNT